MKFCFQFIFQLVSFIIITDCQFSAVVQFAITQLLILLDFANLLSDFKIILIFFSFSVVVVVVDCEMAYDVLNAIQGPPNFQKILR